MRFMLMIPLGYETAPPGVKLDPERVAAMMRYNEALRDTGILITLAYSAYLRLRSQSLVNLRRKPPPPPHPGGNFTFLPSLLALAWR